jgi:alkanesulfonate monooxygenase SsuD/methylene tetrahydromethanopterin reductase-like flavin-dependent oxidoreductase (luciferase family)
VDLRPPLSSRSISLRIYPHTGLDAGAVVTEMCAQSRLAADAGFDGVMTSEHHGGFAGYIPNPLQAAGWLLEAMPVGWAAPCPLLLPLRPPALVAEEVAWLAARHPGRVGVGVAAGSLVDDWTFWPAPSGAPIRVGWPPIQPWRDAVPTRFRWPARR